MSIGVMLFNPFTGTPRHPDDIKSDPDGILVWDGEAQLRAYTAAQPEPINAQLLDTVRELRHALSNVLQHVPAEMWPKWLEVRDRADVVLAAAKGGA